MTEKKCKVPPSASSASRCSGSGTRPPRQRVPDPGLRCTHTDALGRQCRSLAYKSPKGSTTNFTSGLCPTHATEDRQIRETDAIAKYLFKDTPRLNTNTAVNHVLEKLFTLIANNRIPMRNAALLTYLGSLLLNSISGVRGEVYGIEHSAGWEARIRSALRIIQSGQDEDADSDEDSDSDSNAKSDTDSASAS